METQDGGLQTGNKADTHLSQLVDKTGTKSQRQHQYFKSPWDLLK